MKYFSNLRNGWADLTIGDLTLPCSYIQNLPLTILSAYEEFQKKEYCIITIDSENHEHEIIITPNGFYIFTYRNVRTPCCDLSKKFNTYEKKLNFLKDLCNDIIDNVDEWAKWVCISDPKSSYYDKAIKSHKNTILKYAEKIKNIK